MSSPIAPLTGTSTTNSYQALATSVGGSSASGSTDTTASTSATQDLSGTNTFLQLLVAQLKNQDPTSPMDDTAFVTELAQFNTVEQMLGLKQEVTTQVGVQQASESVGLLGHTVSYMTPGLNGGPATTSQGIVTGISLANGGVNVMIGTQSVPLSEVIAVSE